MPRFIINTPSHNTTVQADYFTRDDRGDLKCYNDSVDSPIADVPVENFEGIFRREWVA